jgi:hypothetical protein
MKDETLRIIINTHDVVQANHTHESMCAVHISIFENSCHLQNPRFMMAMFNPQLQG